MSLVLVLYSGISSARNPDITASENAMLYIDNLRSSDLYEISPPLSRMPRPFYLLRDTPRAQNLGLLMGFEYDSIESYNVYSSSGKLWGLGEQFVQISYDLKTVKGQCSAFVSALAEIDIGGESTTFRRGTQVVPGTKLQPGTILVTDPSRIDSPNRRGHTVLLLKATEDYIWVMDQNNGYSVGSIRSGQGIVGIYKIPFSQRADDPTDLLDAWNYFSVYEK